jgi:hypothetical protein
VIFVPTDPKAATTAASAHAQTSQTTPPNPITANTSCDLYPDYPCFQPFNYALAGVIPAATGPSKPNRDISTTEPPWLTAGLAALRILAWILTAILLAGVTGLLRKT